MMHFTVEEENLICMYHNADRRRTIGKITAAMPGIDGDRIKYSPTSANVREKPLKLAVISPERRRLQSLLAPETGTDAQRVYLFRGCAGDSRKAA